MDDRLSDLSNNLCMLLMNHWLMNLSDFFCVDYWLVNLMNNVLMLLVYNIFVVFMNNILVVFVDNLTMMLLNNGGSLVHLNFCS